MTSQKVIFDNDCSKCSRWAAFIEKRDKHSRVELLGQNSSEGKKAMTSIPDRLEGVDSVFLISSEGKWYSKSSAIWRICRYLRFPWPIATSMFLIPLPIRDMLYDIYASMRK
ncbi:MAG: hypothetical protein CMB67_01520 [Euryarchaeota archaeon]|nr:hypothetical protein [Euryarchaeota archaeon]|tara:strand:+ start:2072 stop:2407 length:336 start_codon:yes stop_codon:yes gene_type:complete